MQTLKKRELVIQVRKESVSVQLQRKLNNSILIGVTHQKYQTRLMTFFSHACTSRIVTP